jgi:tRNA(fMet)-specific endonuclease VapC
LNYLLDTNACIALMRREPPGMRARFDREVAGGARLSVPAIVAFELWYGVAKSASPDANAQRLSLFLGAPLSALPFDETDARVAGEIRADFQRTGRPIGAYDILIAGQALARDLILVTANQREFARVKGLRWEDWGTPAR